MTPGDTPIISSTPEFDAAVRALRVAAQQVLAAFPADGYAGETYPFEDSFDDLVPRIVDWDEEVNGS